MSNANDVIALLEGLDKVQLEEVLRRTLKAIVQREYRELMDENIVLKERIEELESANELMLERFGEVQEYFDDVNSWIEEGPITPDISEFV